MRRYSEILVVIGLLLLLLPACSGGAKDASRPVEAAADKSPAPIPDVQASGIQAQTPTEEGFVRKVLYSLEPEESIMDAESAIGILPDPVNAAPESEFAASADSSGVILVLTKGEDESRRYFVVSNGKKKGPFSALEEAMTLAYEGQKKAPERRRPCATYSPGDAPEDVRPERTEENGRQGFRFKGKSSEPYVLVYSVRATPDGARAYYTATNKDKAYFGSSDGRVVSFGGIPTDFKFSPDGKNAAVLCEGTLSLNDMDNLAKLPADKMAEAMKESDKRFLYTIDGKKFGPFTSAFEPYSFWFTRAGNDLFYRVGDDVFRNGQFMFKTDSLDTCTFYPSSDGQKYVFYTYESITFSDGHSYPAPLDVAVFTRAGKTVVKWITLEHKKDLVIYERAM